MQKLLADKRLLFIVVGGVIALLLIVVLISNPPNKVTLDVAVVPSDATLTVDGKEVRAGKISLDKGKHTFKGTRQDFQEATKEIDTATWNKAETVYIILGANSDAAKQWMLDHPEDQMTLERNASGEVTKAQDQLTDKYPILSSLPRETLEYKIDYTTDADKNVTFTITIYTPTPTPDNQARVQKEYEINKQKALDWMRLEHLDPDKEKITFTQF
ncbi:MAG TPA: hypothetical protein VLA88_05865 [Candidatus Saccharimonadales bacterium]|nr:hypothetical protein [Candidatus Saccharimonadales bacterium]